MARGAIDVCRMKETLKKRDRGDHSFLTRPEQSHDYVTPITKPRWLSHGPAHGGDFLLQKMTDGRRISKYVGPIFMDIGFGWSRLTQLGL
jgi:hypothetical protein